LFAALTLQEVGCLKDFSEITFLGMQWMFLYLPVVLLQTLSGGIASNARDGMLISLDAKLAMKEISILLSDDSLSVDLKKHPELVQEPDLILTLTDKHKEEIYDHFKLEDADVYTLREFAGKKGDIEDPSMKGIEGFRKARDEIIYCIIKGMKKYK